MITIYRYGEVDSKDIFSRVVPQVDVSSIVADIIKTVRQKGDAALLDYTERFDKVRLDTLAVSEEEIAEAFNEVEPRFIEILEKAAANIRAFHEKQVRNSFIINTAPGIVMGQKIIPVDPRGQRG